MGEEEGRELAKEWELEYYEIGREGEEEEMGEEEMRDSFMCFVEKIYWAQEGLV